MAEDSRAERRGGGVIGGEGCSEGKGGGSKEKGVKKGKRRGRNGRSVRVA